MFEHLRVVKNVKNLNVLLLEEDYYLLPDSIHVLRKLTQKYDLELFPILNLILNLKFWISIKYNRILSDIDVVSLAVFERAKQNMQMVSLDQVREISFVH